MKPIVIICVLAAVFCLAILLLSQDNPAGVPADSKQTLPSPPAGTGATDRDQDEKEDEDTIFYDQDYFMRKLSQKTLPALKPREKITWAFKLSEKHLFL